MFFDDTITAIASPPGVGAIAVIRLSGNKAFEISEHIFFPYKTSMKISDQEGYRILYGVIKDREEYIDQVLVSFFRNPGSYTGEDTVEISCHGSLYIQQKILNLLITYGARPAAPGEFTQRAFLNGKMDLSQAEAVADLIASESEAAHRVAFNQIRGGFAKDLSDLRQQLLTFISLIELELDFSEEDVVFADRANLMKLIEVIRKRISELIDSFELGNVIKKGIPVAIVGEPNVGKSTLLNVLLNEDKAIVSEIAGTTRDAVEDMISVNGILFRFIDTAGIRHTEDKIETLGIERTMQKIEKAEIILYMVDTDHQKAYDKFIEIKNHALNKKIILIINKMDLAKQFDLEKFKASGDLEIVEISAKHKLNIHQLNDVLLHTVHYSDQTAKSTIITNARHYHLLTKALESTIRVEEGLKKKQSNEFIAQDIREILNTIGEITGEFTSDEVLGNIFRNFCIGK
jgi:tRNA modification GTPase